MALRIAAANFTYPSTMFSCKDKKLSAEASDLSFKPGQEPGVQIYDDACDIGIWIESQVTGNVVPFYVAETECNDENEILAWKLLPVDNRLVQKGVELTIFND